MQPVVTVATVFQFQIANSYADASVGNPEKGSDNDSRDRGCVEIFLIGVTAVLLLWVGVLAGLGMPPMRDPSNDAGGDVINSSTCRSPHARAIASL